MRIFPQMYWWLKGSPHHVLITQEFFFVIFSLFFFCSVAPTVQSSAWQSTISCLATRSRRADPRPPSIGPSFTIWPRSRCFSSFLASFSWSSMRSLPNIWSENRRGSAIRPRSEYLRRRQRRRPSLPERITPWAAAASTGSRGGGTASSATKTPIEHAGNNHTIPFSISISILVILKKTKNLDSFHLW